MSEIKSESISSLVDNYSPSTDDSVSAHLIDNMIKDEHLSSTWQNYHLIGDVLRDEVPQSLQFDLSKTIADAIAQETTILSPKSSIQTSAQAIAKKTNLPSEDAFVQNTKTMPSTNAVIDATNRFKARVSSFVKPMGQVAIAASAAALMIVGVQHNVAENPSSITPSQVVQTMPLTGYANPVSFSLQSPQNESSKLQNQKALNEQLVAERVAQQRRLHALLKDHNQQVKLGSNIK
ncbi:MAG: transcriptional regulator [Colwellia sp.]|uniref:sigma-E factor negative regulatory protein n=1 Tax=Colwellia sp. TaxID=56799 RepID=UPI001DC1A53B|nr:RseA family anti-sigma factor [Colwellia sp.]NQY50376.1 transcriptional regulator [Colwellia sp.]